jgi:multisubunit Na+/H+ antiporter MnhB subunit
MKDKGEIHLERLLVPAAIIAFCLAAWWITTEFDRMPPILKRGIQPSDFPQLIAGLIIVLTLLMMVLDPVRVAERVGNRTWVSMALMGVFAFATLVDFFLALAIFSVGLALLWGERRASALALVGLVMPSAVFLLFDLVFRIRFPRGLLTSLWYG